jgi:4-aminobutyrate aminotransferase-like enzyme
MGDVYPSADKVLFLETLKKFVPQNLAKGALALSGGQAVELALKSAMLKTERFGFIVFSNAYHGLDLGVLPLTAREDFRGPFKSWLRAEQVIRLPYNCEFELIKDAAKKLESQSGGFAGVVVEPIQGRAGVVVPKEGWLKGLAQIAHTQKALMILDEVFTGFGRTGSISVAEEVDADLSCFGKAIGGGFPISACFGTEDVMSAWPESVGEALHTGTFFGHPFSAAVGRRTIEEIVRQNLPQRSIDLGNKAQQFLEKNFRENKKVLSVRGQGLMIGIEFSENGFAAMLMDQLRDEGVIVLPSGETGNVLSLTPALNIAEDLLFEGLQRIVEVLRRPLGGT